MRKVLFFILFFLTLFSFSQNINDSILQDKQIFTKYYQGDYDLPGKIVYNILSSKPDTRKEAMKAQRNVLPKTIFTIAGAGCLIYPIANFMLSGNPENFDLRIFGAGAALMLCAVPFSMAYHKHMGKAVDVYNAKLKKVSYFKENLNINIGYNYLSLKLKI